VWNRAHADSPPVFVDLVYVGVIDIVGEKAAEHPDGLSLLQFVIVFCIAWKIWADLTMWINYFEVDEYAAEPCRL
jgi:low temperature requirement protein LtrA